MANQLWETSAKEVRIDRCQPLCHCFLHIAGRCKIYPAATTMKVRAMRTLRPRIFRRRHGNGWNCVNLRGRVRPLGGKQAANRVKNPLYPEDEGVNNPKRIWKK